MLKITRVEEDLSQVKLKLEGKVTSHWASLLEGECRAFLHNSQSVQLDCADVDFVDAKGIEVLRNLRRRDVILISTPPFVMELLEIGGRS